VPGDQVVQRVPASPEPDQVDRCGFDLECGVVVHPVPQHFHDHTYELRDNLEGLLADLT